MAAAPHITERDQDGVCVLTATGELDLAAAVAFCARIDAARHSRCRRLVLDLSALRRCQASGVRALLRAAEEVLADGGRVAAVPPGDGVAAHLFALAGAGETVPMRDSVAEGVAALRSAKREPDGA